MQNKDKLQNRQKNWDSFFVILAGRNEVKPSHATINLSLPENNYNISECGKKKKAVSPPKLDEVLPRHLRF
jgi:hypothetical protein